MIKKEYIIFAAFVLINVILALNCITAYVGKEWNDIRRSNYEVTIRRINQDKTLFPNNSRVLVPDVGVIWTSKNQFQISFLLITKKYFCVQILDNKDWYKNPDIKKCEEI